MALGILKEWSYSMVMEFNQDGCRKLYFRRTNIVYNSIMGEADQHPL